MARYLLRKEKEEGVRINIGIVPSKISRSLLKTVIIVKMITRNANRVLMGNSTDCHFCRSQSVAASLLSLFTQIYVSPTLFLLVEEGTIGPKRGSGQ